jgi:hypothetical protein
MYLYNAALYCDGCGDRIKREIAEEYLDGTAYAVLSSLLGLADPSDFEDVNDVIAHCDGEAGLDSDDWPKWAREGESDYPEHCANDGDCIDCLAVEDGWCVGVMLTDELTDDGIEYVKDAVRQGGPVAELWRDHYDWIDFDDEE